MFLSALQLIQNYLFLQMPAILPSDLGRGAASPKQQKHTHFENSKPHPGAENVIRTCTFRGMTVLR